jgi:hypothetical protein
MWTLIVLGMGETSRVIVKGVVSPRVNTTSLVSSRVNIAVTHNPLPFVYGYNHYHCYCVNFRSNQCVVFLSPSHTADSTSVFFTCSRLTVLSGPVECNEIINVKFTNRLCHILLKFEATLEICTYFCTIAVNIECYVTIIIIYYGL